MFTNKHAWPQNMFAFRRQMKCNQTVFVETIVQVCQASLSSNIDRKILEVMGQPTYSIMASTIPADYNELPRVYNHIRGLAMYLTFYVATHFILLVST
jgi:hypothetical protein